MRLEEYLACSGEGLAAAVRARELGAAEVVSAALARVAAVESGLWAFRELWADEARERAREVDRLVAAGEPLPLAGVPIAVKGPGGLRAAPARALVAAGCVPVGSTSVPGPGTPWQTWGLGSGGPTANPWRADRTPGGSSAGSGAAVAAGIVPLATGSDGAGSVRIPAAWCGVFGLKTTNGALPSPDRTGLAVPGVLTRRAADARAYLRCVSGNARWAGPGSVGSVGSVGSAGSAGSAGSDRSVGSAGAAGSAGSVRGGESATVRSGPTGPAPAGGGAAAAVWSADLGFADTEPEVAAVARAAALRLAGAGIVRLSEEGSAAPVELADPGPAWLALRTPGADPGPTERVRAGNDERLEHFFGRAELLLTPVTPNRPHGHEGPGDRYSTALTWAFNLSGHPAASIPAGRTADGCPVGLQLVARHGAELLLVEVAEAAELRSGPAAVVAPVEVRNVP